MTTWPTLEAALTGRAGWRRVGQEWHGPCPVTGAGRDCCWAGAGAALGDVRLGCRHCGTGGKLEGTAFREHVAALVGSFPTPTREDAPRRDTRTIHDAGPARVWAATTAPESTPGARYLVDRRHVWSAGVRFPPAVRWLPATRAADVVPHLPPGAVGALVYRFDVPGDADIWAAQVEAISPTGERLLFDGGVKRPSVWGSHFRSGQRVFTVRREGDTARCHLCEGPLDTLALVTLERAGHVTLNGGAVCGAAGTGGFTSRAVPPHGHVTLWPDDDPPGRRAAFTLASKLIAVGRPVKVRPVPGDLAVLAWEAAEERIAISQEGDDTPE